MVRAQLVRAQLASLATPTLPLADVCQVRTPRFFAAPGRRFSLCPLAPTPPAGLRSPGAAQRSSRCPPPPAAARAGPSCALSHLTASRGAFPAVLRCGGRPQTWTWGVGQLGQLGLGSLKGAEAPTPVPALAGKRVVQVCKRMQARASAATGRLAARCRARRQCATRGAARAEGRGASAQRPRVRATLARRWLLVLEQHARRRRAEEVWRRCPALRHAKGGYGATCAVRLRGGVSAGVGGGRSRLRAHVHR